MRLKAFGFQEVFDLTDAVSADLEFATLENDTWLDGVDGGGLASFGDGFAGDSDTVWGAAVVWKVGDMRLGSDLFGCKLC